MSLLNFWIWPHRAMVVVDTEVGGTDGEYSEGSKMIALPAGNVVIAGRGLNTFLAAVVSLAIQVGQDFDGLAEAMPTHHLKAAMGFMEANRSVFDGHEIHELKIALVGYSQRLGRMHGLVFKSKDANGFACEEIDDAFHSPWQASWGEPIRVDTVEHARFISTVQSDNANAMVPDTPCGGRLLLAELTKDDLRMSTLARVTERAMTPKAL